MASKKTSRKKPSRKKPASKVRQADATELISVGRVAPAFVLADQEGEKRRLSEFRGRWVVLYFYPKDNTPGCTSEACQFRDDFPAFATVDAVILGVSPDDAASHARFVGKFDLPFTLLADTGQKVCSAYGVWRQKSMYGRTYMGVVRTTYLIDPKGKVVWRWDKVKVSAHAQAVLDKINELVGK